MLSAAPVAQSYSSFDLHAYLRREARLLGKQGDLPPLPLAMSACVAGISWTIDGVSFRFVWPASSITRKPPGKRRGGKSKRNDDACVLLVRGAHHSALLTSDIGVRQEAFLLDGGVANGDLVMAGQHGSGTSWGGRLLRTMRAGH